MSVLSLSAEEPQKTISSELIQQIDALFSDFNSTPGYAVGISSQGNLIFSKGYGLANLDYQIPISDSSAFNVASLSKQFTAAAIAILIQSNRLNLDDPVSKYLDIIPEQYQRVTIAHLVYMTSGIPEYYRQERPGGRNWYSDYFEIEDAIKISLSKPPDFQPGHQWSYSNVNYMILTEVVSSISGMPFSQFVAKKIFTPLGMTNTHVNDDITLIVPNRVSGYNHREGGGFHQHPRISPHFGGSGIFTSIQDLSKWVRSFYTHELGGKALSDLLLSTRKFNHDKVNDAFGLVWGEFEGRRLLRYDGGDSGFSSYMAMLMDDKIAFFVLSNLGTGRASDKAKEIMRLYFSSEGK